MCPYSTWMKFLESGLYFHKVYNLISDFSIKSSSKAFDLMVLTAFW